MTGSAVSDYHINIFWSDEDGGYIADIPDLGGVFGFRGKPIPVASYRPQVP